MAAQRRSWHAIRAAARWTRRHLALWILSAGAVDGAVIILLNELIARPGQSGRTVNSLILYSLIPLVFSVGFPVAGHLVEQRDKVGEPKRAQEPIAIPRRFPARLYGREKLIADLGSAEPGEIVLLCGVGGVGKTAVAAAGSAAYGGPGPA